MQEEQVLELVQTLPFVPQDKLSQEELVSLQPSAPAVLPMAEYMQTALPHIPHTHNAAVVALQASRRSQPPATQPLGHVPVRMAVLRVRPVRQVRQLLPLAPSRGEAQSQVVLQSLPIKQVPLSLQQPVPRSFAPVPTASSLAATPIKRVP